MSMIRSYQNAAIAVGAAEAWNLETDKTWRTELRNLEAKNKGVSYFGIQIKNGSNEPIRVRVDGSSLAELIIAKKQSEAMIVENIRGIVVSNAGVAEIAANSIVITVTSGASRVSGAAGLGDIYVTEDFGGEVYEDQITAGADAAFALAATSKKIRDAIIYVSGHDALMGDAANQRFPLAVGSSLGLSWVDLSTFYVKNATAGNNTTITIMGVLA